MGIFKSAGLRGNHKLSYDLRPQIILSFFNGDYISGPNGLDVQWREGASNPTGWAHNFITNAYNSGYRRIMLYQPGGHTAEGNSNFISDQWTTLPPYKKSYFQNQLKQWLVEHPDCDLGIYQGWRIPQNNTTGYSTMTYGPDTIPDFKRPGHLKFIQDTMIPWIECGVTFFGLDFTGASEVDATGATPAYLMPWSKFFKDKYQVELIGEALPRPNSATLEPPFKYITNSTPWYTVFATHSGSYDPSGTWAINNRNNRIYIGCTIPGTSTGNIDNLIRRGFIMESYNYLDNGYILGATPGGGDGAGGGDVFG